MKFTCPYGCEQDIGMSETRTLHRCEKHDAVLSYANGLGQRKPLKRYPRWLTPTERRARQRFNEIVASWPCFFRGRRCRHQCSGRKDAHHFVTKDFIRRNYADLPEDELLAILYCPQIGAPLCRRAHDAIKQHPIYFHELTSECIEFCNSVDARYLETLTSAGLRRSSMIERLKRECPERSEVAA